jgi:NAD(P)-dependent dehydrogenase (short-subunit alcohol dehydrogenase family)
MTKFVFITGVSTGIGKALLDTFCQKGYHVIGTVRTVADADKIKSGYGDRVTCLVFDVRDISTMNLEISRIRPLLEKHGLDCLVNNAGYAEPGPLELLSEDAFEAQLDVNLKSVRRITNILLPYLKTAGSGRIINISSVSGILNTPYLGAYCISKHALESMTEIYRRELSQFGIRVISIRPGPIKTEIWRKNIGILDPYFDSSYGHILRHADKLIEASDKNGLPVSRVAETVWKAFSSKHPKTGYVVHKKPMAIWFIAKVLPAAMLDKLMARTMAGGEKIRPV